jgi:hypothetical protein
MKSFDFVRCALASGIAAALFAGCGGNRDAVPVASDADGALAKHKMFHYTGGKQTFTVPGGVTQIKVIALGGNGASWYSTPGGYGGRVSATLGVTPQERLIVYVGGNGSEATGGFNGGGSGGEGPVGSGSSWTAAGGGGASDLRTDPGKRSDRILIAAGGGGAGSGSFGSGPHNPYGGEGGSRTGGSGGTCSTHCGGAGLGGTQDAGGIGGGGASYGGKDGGDGTLAIGGAGGNGAVCCGYGNAAGGGGGGGGGYYGGGGGGGGGPATSYSIGFGGGGGGGSSYVEAGASNVRMSKGWKAGQRTIVFYW